jgi:hypothetical protein
MEVIALFSKTIARAAFHKITWRWTPKNMKRHVSEDLIKCDSAANLAELRHLLLDSEWARYRRVPVGER